MGYPSEQWMALYRKKQEILAPEIDLEAYFNEPEIAGAPLEVFSMGEISIPTGKVLVCDPLAYIHADNPCYFQQVPTGSYRLEAAAVVSDDDCARYAAVRVKFSGARPVRFTLALTGSENIKNLEPGEYTGFPVDAGLATILDEKTKDAYVAYLLNWQEENPGKNLYDDLFSAIFARSYEEHPQYQREGGDWINWTIPDTDLSVPMFQSGFGDGVYPVYFGFDKKGNVCRLVVLFIDLQAYGEEEYSERT